MFLRRQTRNASRHYSVSSVRCSQFLVSVFSSIVLPREATHLANGLGLGLGLAGLVLVIAPKLQSSGEQGLPTAGVIAVFIALLGGTSGTLLQKKFGSGVEVLSGTSWQYVATGVLMGSLALIFEGGAINHLERFLYLLTHLVDRGAFYRRNLDSLLLACTIECIFCLIVVLLGSSGYSSRGLLPLWGEDRPRYCCGNSCYHRWRGTGCGTGESARSNQSLVVFDCLEIFNRWLCNLFSVSYCKALAQL